MIAEEGADEPLDEFLDEELETCYEEYYEEKSKGDDGYLKYFRDRDTGFIHYVRVSFEEAD